MAEYRTEVVVDKETIDLWNKILEMTGNEIYQKYGFKRNENLCVPTGIFSNGYQIDISIVICEGEETPYIDTVLFDENNCEINCEVAESSIDDEYHLSDDEDDYYLTVKSA